ncbi:hypothetical protein SLEP1_g41615 [Rubroshorea leprosula]|uniref:Ribulose-phosphate 3-epimerase n=1 Tax=Rubroshorea leprosula TaxID=152421 RepID=A0AAV5L733_9ROSI|nr:hypothetical protein SLEP1_g41615 [Rubroshorea leprosula]
MLGILKMELLRFPCILLDIEGSLGHSTIDMAASADANCIVAGLSVWSPSAGSRFISFAKVLLKPRKTADLVAGKVH